MLPTRIILLASIKYFLLVFTVGFICGAIRVPFLQPRIGDRYAQLIEAPIMLIAIWNSSNLIVKRLHFGEEKGDRGKPVSTADRLAVGITALMLIIGAEMLGTTLTKGWKDLHSFIFDRDAVGGTVYFALLGLFAILPSWTE
jgi:hypothetical protein